MGEPLDLVPLQIGDHAPVVVRQGFGPGQLGLTQQASQPGLMALLVLLLRQHVQVGRRIPALRSGFLFSRLPLAAELGQLELFQQDRQAALDRRPARGFHPGVGHSC